MQSRRNELHQILHQHNSNVTQGQLSLIKIREREMRKFLTEVYLRDAFHFSDIHRNMNSMGPVQS